MGFGPGIGFGWFSHVVANVIWGLGTFFVFLVIVGILFLLVRFLLVATTAAKLYVAKNSPAPVAAATPTAPATAPAAASATTTTPATRAAAKPATKPAAVKPTTTTPTTKPASKPRTPKTPPAA